VTSVHRTSRQPLARGAVVRVAHLARGARSRSFARAIAVDGRRRRVALCRTTRAAWETARHDRRDAKHPGKSPPVRTPRPTERTPLVDTRRRCPVDERTRTRATNERARSKRADHEYASDSRVARRPIEPSTRVATRKLSRQKDKSYSADNARVIPSRLAASRACDGD
jgi:hypothetical protein